MAAPRSRSAGFFTEDFGEALTPELRESEASLRAQAANK